MERMLLIWIIGAISYSLMDIVASTKFDGKISTSSRIVTPKTASLKITCNVDSFNHSKTSPYIAVYLHGKQLLSEIVDDNTISSTIRFDSENSSFTCGKKQFTCQLNSQPIDETSVTFSEPPPRIDKSQFNCVSENLEYLSCHFPDLDACLSDTSYSLMMRSDDGYSSCKLREINGSMYFDSRDGGSCTYNPDVEKLEFVLRSSNVVGSVLAKFRLNNFDIVRPAPVYSLDWTPRQFSWKSVKNLGYLGRTFQYQFRATCSQNVTMITVDSRFMIFNAAMSEFPPCTKLLAIRLRIVPLKTNSIGEGLWSEWQTIEIKRTRLIGPGNAYRTEPVRNVIQPVHTVYSSKGRGDHTSLELYWIFSSDERYNVSMESVSSQKQDPTSITYEPTHGIALYKNVQPKVYKIGLPKSTIKIIPHDESHRPKIKRVVNNNGSFEVSWFPVTRHDLVSYNILHCHYTVTDFCQNSVVLTTLPPKETNFNIYSKVTLNFAISANYRNFSSSLSWIKCTVHAARSEVGPPQFSIIDVTDTSLSIHMETPCPDRSFYESLEIEVRSSAGNEVFREIFESHVDFVRIPHLIEDTRYEVIVGAFDGSRYRVGRTSTIVQTAKKASSISSSIYLYVGILLGTILMQRISSKIRRVINIDVELPLGLMEIYEAKAFSVNLNCSVNDVSEKFEENFLPIILEEEYSSIEYFMYNPLEDLEYDATRQSLNDYVDVNTILQNTHQGPVEHDAENPTVDGYVAVDILRAQI